MTFDDGIVKVYKVINQKAAGEIPKKGLEFLRSFHLAFQNIGITRMYEAIKANQQVDAIIAVYSDREVTTNDIAILEDDKQYIIRTIQPTVDENGIKIMKLALERNGENFEIVDRKA